MGDVAGAGISSLHCVISTVTSSGWAGADLKKFFEDYFAHLRRTSLDEKTEHTDRGALETLLQAIAAKQNRNNRVVHEPGRQGDKGAPDFKVMQSAQIVGYVENKKIDDDLLRVAKGEQIARYSKLSGNILLTDYLQFILIENGKIAERATLAYSTDLIGRTGLADSRIAEVQGLIEKFFSVAPTGIGRSQQLALALAARSRLLRDFLGEELLRQGRDHTEGRLFGLFQVFRDQIFHELTTAEFADAFAQMLGYGLFLARLNSGSQAVTLQNARQFVPGAFSLIRELVDFIGVLDQSEYRDVRWVVEEVLSIVNGLDLAAIHQDLSFRNRKATRGVRAGSEEEHRLFERDPFIYFYEDFLKHYDKETRKGRGVYYTPPPVVNFIVRAIDDILKDTFQLPDGLADNRNVTVLDFACGTGTFLLEVFQQVFANIGGPEAGRADPMVRQHFLRNMFGFEYLIAPYTIAHLKLSQYLQDQGHPLQGDERLRVYLTNTLEPVQPQRNFLLPAVSAEVEAAQRVKDRNILVITGNPPYSGESRNKGDWIARAISGYKFTVETDAEGNEFKQPLGERNPKWLNDDYVKFIRFAQLKMDAAEEGIVGIITNHSWLDNPTFRGMRQSLMRSFEQIYVFDLHGSGKKKERAPDGSKDENVFDIEQGVAISVFVKRKGIERGVWRGDLWGRRLDKYSWLANGSLRAAARTLIEPAAPHYLIAHQEAALRTEYEVGAAIPEIFVEGGTGIITKRDSLAIQYSEDEIWSVVREFSSLSVSDARERFSLPDDVRDWKVADAQADVLLDGPDRRMIKRILYRPFDDRFTYYTGRSRGFLGWPVERLNRHFGGGNVALITSRLTKGETFRHVQVTDKMNEVIVMSSITSNNGFTYPLRLHSDTGAGSENLSTKFRAFIDAKYSHHYSPEEILGYIYAILHAPAYRRRYAEFLRIDFPRIPFADSQADFDALSAHGWSLVEAHLLRRYPRRRLADFHGKGTQVVEFVRYAEADNTVAINDTQRFGPVPKDVWNLHIGGYQVLEKYLKSRKGRVLSLDEINHVSAVADSLAFTIEQMAKIDGAYKRAFPDAG